MFYRRKAAREAEQEKAAQAAPVPGAEMTHADAANFPAPGEYAMQPPYGSPPPTGAWPQDQKDVYYNQPGYQQPPYQPSYSPNGYQAVYPEPIPYQQGHNQQELDSVPAAMEMDAAPRPMYELPQHTYSHELVGSEAGSPIVPPQEMSHVATQEQHPQPPPK